MGRKELLELFNKYQKHPDFLEEISDINQKNIDGDNMLHIATRKKDIHDIKVLIEYGINIDDQGDLGYTAIHYACINGYQDIVELLLFYGANPNIKDEFGQTALDIAFSSNEHNKKKIISILKKNIKNKKYGDKSY
ncbi:ankyrin repeat domain-containing protein [Volucribacter amazonae]|uniref:Ankyrin repeat protein n=1 Tax=Volucribacter amazonae TaxID=256731 RepID=A0A9X4PM17_9PAST|nr:ankyrin repeat domain-containing protein [Volucribacter amazonae]MDG6894308.1 hypothetical protein [Volucribacter amazonae]